MFNPAAFAGVVVIVVIALSALIDQHKQTERAYETAKQEYDESKRVAPSRPTAKGQDSDHKAYRDEWRSEYDLEAQREMARTSWWMAAFSLVGVILLAATFWETARAAQGAADAAAAARDALGAERAWITHDGFNRTVIGNHHVDGRPVPRGLGITFHWRNTGRSPALKAEVYFDLQERPLNAPIPDFAVFRPPLPQSASIGPGQQVSTVMKTLDDQQYDRLVARQSTFFVYSHIQYRDVFAQDKELSTEVSGQIFYDGENVDAATGRSVPIIRFRTMGRQNTVC